MEYLIGSKNEFFNFVDKINEEDKIAILTHTDLDGLASGVFLQKIFEAKNLNLEFIDFISLGSDMLKSRVNELKDRGITKLFICDLSVDEADFEGFEKMRDEIDTFLIDHHPFKDSLKEQKNIIKGESHDCVGYITYDLGEGILEESEWSWLVCATMFTEFSYNSDANLEFMQKFYPDLTRENISTTIAGMNGRKISSALIYFDKDLRHVYDLLLDRNLEELTHAFNLVEDELNRCLEDFSKNSKCYEEQKIYVYFLESKFKVGSPLSTILSKMKPEYSFLIMRVDGDYIKISSRNQAGNKDMNQLMKAGVKGTTGMGGGHKKASGAKIKKEEFDQFTRNILAF